VLVHKAAVALVAENRQLAAPASVHPLDTSTGQEDFQAFAFVAGEQLGRILDNLELLLSGELVAARQARHLGGRPLPPVLEAVVERVAADVPPVAEDRPLSADLERVRALVRSAPPPG
jgi:histidine ammonia-lyase